MGMGAEPKPIVADSTNRAWIAPLIICLLFDWAVYYNLSTFGLLHFYSDLGSLTFAIIASSTTTLFGLLTFFPKRHEFYEDYFLVKHPLGSVEKYSYLQIAHWRGELLPGEHGVKIWVIARANVISTPYIPRNRKLCVDLYDLLERKVGMASGRVVQKS